MCFPDNKGSPVLQQAEVELIDQTLCVSTYGIITSRMLCAGVLSGKRDACRVSYLTVPLLNMLYFHECFHVWSTQPWEITGASASLNSDTNYNSVV